MITLIDNYDSFTYNLVHYIGELGFEVEVFRNDQIEVEELWRRSPEAIVLSPGPGRPESAGISLDVVKSAPDDMPIFGVCLGHQTIGQAFGGDVVLADEMMHGKTSAIRHQGEGVFDGLPDGLTATRYHSLVVDAETLPDCLQPTANTDDGVLMGMQHKTRPIHSVQFHPESIASEHGHDMLKNFLDLARAKGA